MANLIMARHGASVFNDWDVFTGWVDIPLSHKGIDEAFKIGELIADEPIDVIFTSTLTRAITSALLAMSLHKSGKIPVITHFSEGQLGQWSQIYSEETEKKCIPLITSWQLNERMYGELQGMKKEEMRLKFGEEQVQKWRRSFEGVPPGGESLKMTAERAIPYFKEVIVPYLESGKNVFISAHGNSLRAIEMALRQLSAHEVVSLEIATGEVITYRFEEGVFVRA